MTSTAHIPYHTTERTIDRNDPNIRTLKGLLSAFMTHPSPQILAGITVTSLGARIAIGSWAAQDAVIAATIAAWWPIQETIFHRCILHARPFTVFGTTIDVGKFHREHHQHPRDLNGFIPLKLFYGAPLIGLGLSRLVLGNWPRALTAFTVWFGLAFNYEWSHFFVHAPYAPRTRWGQRLKKDHLLHHFHNETFWWEVSTPGLFDRLLMKIRGFPFWSTAKDIPHSATTHTVF